MERLTDADRQSLLNVIALREANAGQLMRRYKATREELQSFVEENQDELERIRLETEASEEDSEEPTPAELANLWIANKTERLQKLQNIADRLYIDCMNTFDAATLREFRSYCAAAANELGQLLHRGAGESGSDTLSVDIQGVSIEDVK